MRELSGIDGDLGPILNDGQIGVYYWKQDEGFGNAVVGTLENMGYDPAVINRDDFTERISELSLLLIYGPWGSLEPVARRLRGISPAERPAVVLWQSEQFPNPKLHAWVWRTVGLGRSYLDTLGYHQAPNGTIIPRPAWGLILSRLHRFRYFGDLLRYSRSGFLDVVAVWSKWTTEFLIARGVPAMTAYMGNYAGCGRDLGLQRDIPVLWLGKPGSGRRGQLVRRVHDDLDRRGIKMLVVDGVEHPYVFGEERTKLLNRAKFTLNLLRQSWDNTSMRFFLASANKSVLISEPMLPHIPFDPGVHFIQTPVDEITGTIADWLGRDAEREAMAERAYQLGVEQITMKASLHKIITHAIQKKRRSQNGDTI